MKKINGGYLSLFEYLVYKDFPFANAIDAKLYPIENSTIRYENPYTRRYNETPPELWTDQFIGALQPIASMANDVEYTFKPYKSSREFLMDVAQPIRGLGNILRGLANVVATPLFFLGYIVSDAFTSGSLSNFSDSMKENLGLSTSWLIDGLSSIVRGSTQIVATPLTVALRMPLRGIITAIKGTPDISENEEIQHLVDLGHQAIKKEDVFKMDCIRYGLHAEYLKSVSRGQHSNISPDQEEKAFNCIKIIPKNRDNGESFNSLHLVYAPSALKFFGEYLDLFRKQEAPLSVEPSSTIENGI